uniref:Uncharacterized protein n=1 Tax=Ciona intestinalis TaxID=7719 RepID=H2XYS8_CIOIN
MINQPLHAKLIQFVVKELLAQLCCKKRHVLDNREANSPFSILCKFHDSWKQGLR